MNNITQMKTRQQLEDELKKQLLIAVIENSKKTWLAIKSLRDNLEKFDIEVCKILEESNDILEKILK